MADQLTIAKALLAASNANIAIYGALTRIAAKANISTDPEISVALDEVIKRVNAQIEAVGGVVNG